MSFSDALEVGRPYKKKPWFGVLHGLPKVSKTGSVIYAPKPFIIAIDPGCEWVFGNKKTAQLCQTFQHTYDRKDSTGNVLATEKRLTVAKSTDDVFQMIAWIANNAKNLEEKPKTVILEGIRFFNEFVINEVCLSRAARDKEGKALSIPDFESFGISRYDLCLPYWTRLFAGIERVRSRGMNVLIVAHSAYKNRTATNTAGAGTSIVSYKEVNLDLPEWGGFNIPNELALKSDFVYYIKSRINVGITGSGKWAKVVGTNGESETQIFTRGTTEFYAGTRAVNQDNIQDVYEFSPDNREEVLTQMFLDIDK